ncbi:MAG: hypothetical protein ABR575_02495 [Actinomycetota bacterium]
MLLTKDTITIEPDVLEYKLYARGVGPVLILGISCRARGADRDGQSTGIDRHRPLGSARGMAIARR